MIHMGPCQTWGLEFQKRPRQNSKVLLAKKISRTNHLRFQNNRVIWMMTSLTLTWMVNLKFYSLQLHPWPKWKWFSECTKEAFWRKRNLLKIHIAQINLNRRNLFNLKLTLLIKLWNYQIICSQYLRLEIISPSHKMIHYQLIL